MHLAQILVGDSREGSTSVSFSRRRDIASRQPTPGPFGDAIPFGRWTHDWPNVGRVPVEGDVSARVYLSEAHDVGRASRSRHGATVLTNQCGSIEVSDNRGPTFLDRVSYGLTLAPHTAQNPLGSVQKNLILRLAKWREGIC